MLAKLDQLLKFGENEQVLEILTEQNSLSLEERIYKARALEMRFDESIFEAEEIINDVIHQLKPLNDKILELKARSAKLHILMKFQNFRLIQQELDAWIHLWEQCTEHEKETLKLAYAAYLTAKSFTNQARTTDREVWNSVSQEIDLAIEIFEQFDDYHDVSWAIYWKFGIEMNRENKEAFQEALSKATGLRNKITNIFTSTIYIKWWNEILRLYFLTGIKDKDFRSLEEIHSEAREFLPPWLYFDYVTSLCIEYSRSGQYSKVIEVASKIVKITPKVNNLHSLAWAKRVLGDAYVQVGSILKGKMLIEEALKINRVIDDPTCLALCLVEVSKLNYYLGKTEKALDHLREAIRLFTKEKSLMFLSPYYFYVMLLLEQGRRTEVEKIVDTLKQNYQKYSSTNFSRFVEALLLKYETRATKKVMAQTKLEQLLKTPPEGKWLSQEIHFYVVTHYLDLLLHEFNEFQEQEVLEEISTILNETKQLAQIYGQTNFLVQFSVIEAKLFLVKDRFQDAHELLETLTHQASVVNIPRLKSQVEKELVTLEDQFRVWKQLVESNVSLGEKIEKADLMRYIEQASKRVIL